MSRSKSNEAKKRAMFKCGAAAAQRYTGSSEFYYCPICANPYSLPDLVDKKALTLEHAPARSIGGKEIALTCASCNKKAGHDFEFAIKARRDENHLGDVIAGAAVGEGGRVCFQAGGERVEACVSRGTNGVVTLKIREPVNSKDPRVQVIERSKTYAERLVRDNAGEGEAFQIEPWKSYDNRLAMVGDLKAAFIVAFAAFGYRYAFDPRLEPVRLQIFNPKAQIIEGWSSTSDPTGNEPYLAQLREPIPSILVNFGVDKIILPWLCSPENFYNAWTATIRPNEQLHLSGWLAAWPTTLRMALDFGLEY